MLKISVLLLFCLLPLSNEMPVDNKDALKSYIMTLLNPYVKETLFFARNDSALIYLNLAIQYIPIPIEERVSAHYDKRHVSVSFKTQEAQWMTLCEQKGTESLDVDPFEAGGHPISASLYCDMEKEPITTTTPEPVDFDTLFNRGILHYLTFIIISIVIVGLIFIICHYKADIMRIQVDVRNFAADTFSLISHQ